MPIKFSSLRKYKPDICTIPQDEGEPLKFITNMHWLVPIAAVKDVPMDLAVKNIRGQRVVSKYAIARENNRETFEKEYFRFEKTNIGIRIENKEKGTYDDAFVFRQDIVGTPVQELRYLLLNRDYVELFDIEEIYQYHSNGHVEFSIDGKYFCSIMPMAEQMQHKSTFDNHSHYSFMQLIEYMFGIDFDHVVDRKVDESTKTLHEIEAKHVDKINELQMEIVRLKNEVQTKNVSEIVKSWPQPIPNMPDLSKTMANVEPPSEDKQINSVDSLVKYLKINMPATHEVFVVLYLNQSNNIIEAVYQSVGTDEQTAVYPREIARHALKIHATGVICAHNHPSGHLQPSNADREITRMISKSVLALEIRMLDHIIVGSEGKGYFSFRENGLIL